MSQFGENTPRQIILDSLMDAMDDAGLTGQQLIAETLHVLAYLAEAPR